LIEIELDDEKLMKPAGCALCGCTVGLVPSPYGSVCMRCVLADKQIGANHASLLFTLPDRDVVPA
jgi:hypothetical protein